MSNKGTKNMSKSSNKDTLKRILQYIKKYIPLIVISLIMAAGSVAMQLYAPILQGDAIDYIVEKGIVDFDTITKILVRLGIVIMIMAICQLIMNFLNNKITYHVVNDIRKQAFNHLERLPLKYIDSKSQGEVVSRIINDIDQFSDGLLMGFSQLFTGMVTIIGTLVFMFTINVKIALVVVVVTPLSLLVASYIAKKTYNLFLLQSDKRGELTGLVDEMVGNEKIVQAFSYEEISNDRFVKINDELQDSSMKATFFSSLTNPSTRFVNSIVYALVGIIGAFTAIKNPLFTVGQLSCFLSYANQYTKPFNEISGVITELQNAIACAARVFELIDEEPEVSDASNKVLTDVSGEIEISNVDFSYTKDKELIKDLNLSVDKGKRVAIVGPTGCGKSTIINLLMRFYDVDSGSIKVDGNDIKDITRKSLRSNYGMVLQETWLKSGTVKENIAYGKPEATMEEIIEAAKLSHAHSFIKRLPNGYDTVLTEDGGGLSQGQKQLLCITRVMLSLPPMLILDEATSSIDTRTELKIQSAFARMMEGRTSFIVAHRLSTIKEANTILVMKDGSIIEQGNHNELIAKGGFYYNLYNSQFDV